MKYLTHTINALCAGAVLLLLSCDDFLYFEPINTPISSTFWQTESDANSAVLGAYYELKRSLNGSRDYITYGDWPTQLFDKTEHEHRGNFQHLGNNSLTDWSKFYKVILAANVSINRIGEMTDKKFQGGEAKRNSYIGEALFIRAYSYFYMVRIWKTVPLVTEAIEDASDAIYEVPLATEDELLNQCVADLKLADSYLSWNLTDGRRTRANRATVNALLAHVYMWRTRANKDESDIDKEDFTKAINCIDEIETNSNASLVAAKDFHNIWHGNSKESLFEFSYLTSNNEGFDKGRGLSDYYLGDPYVTDRKGKKVRWPFSPPFFAAFKQPNEDLRVQYLFENFPVKDYCFTTKYDQIEYTNADKTNWRTEATLVIWRLADMYLLKAEAFCKKEAPDIESARFYLNKVRERAGIDDYPGADGDVYEAIVDERSCELFLEGHRLYDWVRTGFYAKKSYLGRYSEDRYQAEGYLWPVNYKLFNVDNSYIVQTPYWRDKM